MDRRLLTHYEQELQYLRELGGEFARDYPKIAGHLGLDEFECADPYVERLIEGCALLAARVQLKMDAEFPRFTEHVLGMVSPHLLSPTPSMGVVQLSPSEARQATLVDGATVPRGTTLKASVGSAATPVVYRTGAEVELWPLEIVSLRHGQFLGDLGELRLSHGQVARGVLRIKIRSLAGVPLSALRLDKLPLFVRGEMARATRLYELLVGSSLGVVVLDAERVVRRCPNGKVRPLGLETDDSLLPSAANSFSGHRQLQEYFALPSRFLFVGLEGLREGLRHVSGSEAELVVVLDRYDAGLESDIDSTELVPFCAPVINLFERTADRIRLSNRDHEYHVVPDRTRPLDFEVYSVLSVKGIGTGPSPKREFHSLFACTDRTAGDEALSCYTVHREPTRSSSARGGDGPRSTYAGSETYVSLTDGGAGGFADDIKQLSVRCLCTNRDLPLSLTVGKTTGEFSIESGAPVDTIRFVAGPSKPQPALSWGPRSWRLLNHLSLNYLSLTNSGGGRGAEALRELLAVYAESAEAGVRRQVDGVISVESTPVVRRLPLPGPATFARGLRVELGCDEHAFEGSGTFLLGSLLDRFFSGYASINCFVQTALSTRQRERVVEWPLRLGVRPAL